MVNISQFFLQFKACFITNVNKNVFSSRISLNPDHSSKASLLHKRIILVSQLFRIYFKITPFQYFNCNMRNNYNCQPAPLTLTLLLPTVANTRGSPSLLCQLN